LGQTIIRARQDALNPLRLAFGSLLGLHYQLLLALTLAGLCGHHHQPARGERSEAERPGSVERLGYLFIFKRSIPGDSCLVVVRRPAQTRAVGGCGQWLSGRTASLGLRVGLNSLWTQTQEQP